MRDFRPDVRSRLAALRLSPTREADIVEEIAQHLEDRCRELVSGGASPDAAEDTVLAELGTDRLARFMEPLRQAHAPAPVTPGAPAASLVSGLWQDTRYAIRSLIKHPSFAAAAILTLALGIGASTAIFSVVYGVLLKPLPFVEPDRLVSLEHLAPAWNNAAVNQGPTTYLAYRDNQQVFEGIAGWESGEVSITGRGEPEQVESLSVTASMLPLLREQPMIGRGFSEADDDEGSPLRVMLTAGYWQRQFGGARDAIGQSLVVDGTPAEIVGVLPPSFRFLRARPEVLVPLQLPASSTDIGFDFQAVGRLRSGVTQEQARGDVGRMIGLLPRSYGVLKLQPFVRPLASYVTGDVGRLIWILFAAVSVVFLIACGNVANLFLVRAEGRQHELAMRAALGATRGLVARVLLAESLVLGLAGGTFGVVLAQATVGLLRRLAPAQLPRIDEIAVDGTVLLFALGVSLLSGLLFGLVAVLKFGGPGVPALRETARSTTGGRARHGTRNSLVVAQIALALTLMIVSALMIRTFRAMQDVPPGFTAADTIQTFRVALPEEVAAGPEEIARMFRRIAERLAAVPGVASIGVSSSITMDGEDNSNPLYVEDAPQPAGSLPPFRRFKSVAPGYFATMGNRVVAGRDVTWADVEQQRPVVIVSEAFAREYWQDPARAIGRRVAGPSSTPPYRSPWREIVGVTGDERDDGLDRPATSIAYFPMLNDTYVRRTMAFAVRSDRVGSPGFSRELQQAVWSINPDLPLASVQTLAEIEARSMARTSFAMVMLAIAAAVALLIGVVGIYGVIAFVAAQRTREIGIRMALGAQLADVRSMFLAQGLRLIAAGIAAGVGIALALTRAMSALLFGVGPMDPATYAASAGLLATVALIAMYLPARRAARMNPVIALRADS